MLTPEEKRARELAQNATKGTWERLQTDIISPLNDEDELAGIAEWVAPEDADFIVAIQPKATLQLLTRLEEALKENEELKDKVVELEGDVAGFEEDIRMLESLIDY